MKSIDTKTSECICLHQNIDDHKIVECPICSREINPYWEPRYNGVRATCNVCEINWAES